MKVRVRLLLALGLAGLAVGAAVFWLGWINISASSGHWVVTDWVLHTAMRRSVQFHADDIQPPADLADPALVRRGAGHFETGCAPCHGSPARPRGAVVHSMLPVPPDLATRVADWKPRELYWIVRHGVKFSGMPAWPAARDDEPWALAAFLVALPEMSASDYWRLAFGAAAPEEAAGGLSLEAKPIVADCKRCHGEAGLGEPNGAFPRLDIQPEAFLLAALHAYRNEERASGIMQSAVVGMSDAELAELAKFYAAPKPVAPAPLSEGEVATEVLARGKELARHGAPADDIAACEGCHAPNGKTSRKDFPRLNGQYLDYLISQLRLFARQTGRGGGRFSSLMASATHTLEPADIEAVAAYYATRPPRPTGR